jgi:hypothetical protein
MLACGAALVPAPASSAGYEDAMAWLRTQQEHAQEFRVSIDQGSTSYGEEVLTGEVSNVSELDGERVATPWLSFSGSHSDSYVGPVQGTWGNVAEPEDFRVAVFSETDALYLQGVYPLQTNGTWNSGEGEAHKGRKVATLVRVANEETVAVSGGGHTRIDGVELRIFLRTDVDYLQQVVPLYADGTWTSTSKIASGEVIVRLVNSTTARTINTSEWANATSFEGLLRSFWIPQNDPDYGYEGETPDPLQPGYRLEQRSWIYDDAVAALAFIQDGEPRRAASILGELESQQAEDGSLPFSLDVYLGQVAENYRRSGALAWVGTAAVEYERATGDTQFRDFADQLADYLCSLQVTAGNGFEANDPRYGSVLGGVGWYDEAYNYYDTPVEWVSTEHNIDAYFFLRDLGYLEDDLTYANAAVLIKESLLLNHWDSEAGHFYQGVSPEGTDPGEALDLGTWGGLFLQAIGETAKAESSLEFAEEFEVSGRSIVKSFLPIAFNQTYTSPETISGYQPYLESEGYEAPPSVAWAEGTWGAILLKNRLNEDAAEDVASMETMQEGDPRGGFVQVTEGRRSLPYEFHVWPAVAGTAWAALVQGHSAILWRPDRPESEPAGSALLQEHAPILRYDTLESYRADSAAEATDNYRCCELEGSNALHDANNDVVATANPALPSYKELSMAFLGARGLNVASGDDSIDLLNSTDEDALYMHLQPRYADYIYGRIVDLPEEEQILQYWFFYYYNPHAYVGFGAHEGDWEMVQIHLSANQVPLSASYAQHGGGVRCEWNELEHNESDRPIVYVAEGSHASYFQAGHHYNGAAFDSADGEGTETSDFTIENISEIAAHDWLSWKGRWGGSDGGLGKSESPRGPVYQGDSWDDPGEWEESAESCGTS